MAQWNVRWYYCTEWRDGGQRGPKSESGGWDRTVRSPSISSWEISGGQTASRILSAVLSASCCFSLSSCVAIVARSADGAAAALSTPLQPAPCSVCVCVCHVNTSQTACHNDISQHGETGKSAETSGCPKHTHTHTLYRLLLLLRLHHIMLCKLVSRIPLMLETTLDEQAGCLLL